MQYEKMNPEVKADWLTALRSGEYPQDRYYLGFKGKYCCLGVLSELAHKAGVVSREDDPYVGFQYGKAQESCTLPGEVAEWAKVSEGTEAHSPQSVLMGMNDRQGRSFIEIADWIEENL